MLSDSENKLGCTIISAVSDYNAIEDSVKNPGNWFRLCLYALQVPNTLVFVGALQLSFRVWNKEDTSRDSKLIKLTVLGFELMLAAVRCAGLLDPIGKYLKVTLSHYIYMYVIHNVYYMFIIYIYIHI